MMRPTSFSRPTLASIGRALIVGGLGLVVLTAGPAPAALAAGTVDLSISLGTSPMHTGEAVNVVAHGSHAGAATSGAQVRMFLDSRFANPRVTNAGGFACGPITTDGISGTSVWSVTCTKGAVGLNDMVQMSAIAPNMPGNYALQAQIDPSDATETNDTNNVVSMTLDVTQLTPILQTPAVQFNPANKAHK